MAGSLTKHGQLQQVEESYSGVKRFDISEADESESLVCRVASLEGRLVLFEAKVDGLYDLGPADELPDVVDGAVVQAAGDEAVAVPQLAGAGAALEQPAEADVAAGKLAKLAKKRRNRKPQSTAKVSCVVAVQACEGGNGVDTLKEVMEKADAQLDFATIGAAPADPRLDAATTGAAPAGPRLDAAMTAAPADPRLVTGSPA